MVRINLAENTVGDDHCGPNPREPPNLPLPPPPILIPSNGVILKAHKGIPRSSSPRDLRKMVLLTRATDTLREGGNWGGPPIVEIQKLLSSLSVAPLPSSRKRYYKKSSLASRKLTMVNDFHKSVTPVGGGVAVFQNRGPLPETTSCIIARATFNYGNQFYSKERHRPPPPPPIVTQKSHTSVPPVLDVRSVPDIAKDVDDIHGNAPHLHELHPKLKRRIVPSSEEPATQKTLGSHGIGRAHFKGESGTVLIEVQLKDVYNLVRELRKELASVVEEALTSRDLYSHIHMISKQAWAAEQISCVRTPRKLDKMVKKLYPEERAAMNQAQATAIRTRVEFELFYRVIVENFGYPRRKGGDCEPEFDILQPFNDVIAPIS